MIINFSIKINTKGVKTMFEEKHLRVQVNEGIYNFLTDDVLFYYGVHKKWQPLLFWIDYFIKAFN